MAPCEEQQCHQVVAGWRWEITATALHHNHIPVNDLVSRAAAEVQQCRPPRVRYTALQSTLGVVVSMKPVSYRLPEQLKSRLNERARSSGTTETTLVTQLLHEGLVALEHPGLTYRDGPSGRRAALVHGPDVAEVVMALQHADGAESERLSDAADQLGLPVDDVERALDFAAAHATEVDERISTIEAAADHVRDLARARRRLLSAETAAAHGNQ